MTNPSRVVLVGMPGSGKTTVGRELAKRLGMRFLDTDHEIEVRTGVKIPTIFEIEGEAGFRRRETQTLDALTGETGVVLATGGGAVIAAENRQMLAARGGVVYLNVPPHIHHIDAAVSSTIRDKREHTIVPRSSIPCP